MKKRNLFKLAALTAVFALGSMFANAQNTTTDIPKLPNAAPSTINGSVKVIDNKGTVKYIQAKNGITTFTNSTTDVTTTTFQLGGTLTDNTYIDVDGHVFAFNGLALETGAASTNATDQSDAGTGSGWTLLVRDEASGAIRKMLVSDMVQSGWTVYQLTAAQVTTPQFTITGVSLASYQTVYIYRNGAKLIAGIDYTIGTTDVITLLPSGAGTQGTPTTPWAAESYNLYAGDVIEVHFIK